VKKRNENFLIRYWKFVAVMNILMLKSGALQNKTLIDSVTGTEGVARIYFLLILKCTQARATMGTRLSNSSRDFFSKISIVS
jgi:hypothetical protein